MVTTSALFSAALATTGLCHTIDELSLLQANVESMGQVSLHEPESFESTKEVSAHNISAEEASSREADVPLLLAVAEAGVGRQGACGIAANVGKCQEEYDYLRSISDPGDDTHTRVNCMGYGGPSDPCTLSITNDQDFGMSKNPENCQDGVLFLWDEPYTQGERGFGDWRSASYQVSKWKQYAARWSTQLSSMRSAGMKVTSPMFTQKSGRQVTDVMKRFLDLCGSGCSTPGHREYIDILIWNAWIGDWSSDTVGQVRWIKDIARQMKRENGERPVWLGNFGFLGPTADVTKQIDVIENSGIFDMDGALDSVYYFAARDYGGGIPDNSNLLKSRRGDGMTVGKALLNKCHELSGDSGATPSPPSPTPSDSSCHTAVPGEECFAAVNWAKSQGIKQFPDWYPDLSEDSPFEDFQRQLSQQNHANCRLPCAPVTSCHTAVPGEECYNAVNWAMSTGIYQHSDWYPGLTQHSSFEEFQTILQRNGHADCDVPC